jgi:hypothetical protein
MRRNWGHFTRKKRSTLPAHRTGQTPTSRCIDSPVRRRGGVKYSKNGVVFLHHGSPSLRHMETIGSTNALRPLVPTHQCTKARSKQVGAFIYLCGDGVASNVARMGSFCNMDINPPLMQLETNGPLVPTHQCTADALRQRSRLAMDVGE